MDTQQKIKIIKKALMTEWLAGFFTGLLLCFVATCTTKPAMAETGLYLDLAGGATQFMVTAQDGDYRQEGLPHTFDLTSAAYRVGLGWTFNEQWSIQAAYINLGTLKQSAVFVSDEHYDRHTTHCLNGCPNQAHHTITDAYQGGELTVTRTFAFDSFDLFLKGGGALLLHRFTIHRLYDGTFLEHYGRFPATVVGAGGCYGAVCLETTYYHGIGGSNCLTPCGWPLSKEMFVSLLSVKLPIPH